MWSKPADVGAIAGETLAFGSLPDFDDFYRKEMPRLVMLARALCGSLVAEDVAQEAMLTAYRRWRVVGGLEYREAWVRRTCSNLAVSQYRRKLVELKALTRLSTRPQPPGLGPADEAFWAAIRQLPRRQAQAAALRYLYELDVADIARTLAITEGAVKQHLTRARARLVAELDLTDAHPAKDPAKEPKP